MLGNFSSGDFFQNSLFQKTLSGTLSEYVSNVYYWDVDQDRRSVSPDLGPNCLQRLSADKEKSALANSEERAQP